MVNKVEGESTSNLLATLKQTVSGLLARLTGKASEGLEGTAVSAKGEKVLSHIADAGETILEKSGELRDKLPDGVKEKIGKVREALEGNIGAENLEKIKENGGLVAGGALAADGVRRIVSKDENGKRQIVKGVVEAGVGAGLFAASVAARRASGGSSDKGIS